MIKFVIDMAKKSKRKQIRMKSTASNFKGYVTVINPANEEEKLELRKYDPFVRKHVKFVQDNTNLGRNVVRPRKS